MNLQSSRWILRVGKFAHVGFEKLEVLNLKIIERESLNTVVGNVFAEISCQTAIYTTFGRLTKIFCKRALLRLTLRHCV